MLIVKLTQEKMGERLMYLSTLEATVLEVKVIEGNASFFIRSIATVLILICVAHFRTWNDD